MNFDDFDIRWRQRGDESQLDAMENALRSVVNFEESIEIEYSISWRLARLHHFRMMQESDAAKAHDQLLNADTQTIRALMLNSEGAEAYFWRGVCLSERTRARKQNLITRLQFVTRAQQYLHAAAHFDASFHFAGAFRVLGRITHLKPHILGGGARKSLSYFEDALKIAPDNSTTLLYFAEALRAAKDHEKSLGILQQIIAQPIDDAWKWEQARDREMARGLLQK